ncbi:hypothetical protein BDZ94DRAFT_970127 [Collybia nuda]|uniref:F-box domain-containing protein n=1 Tax=Collybia nuda TaxID=64659 RepID=A0A9P5YE59_9AGAR|nr:hypothetical protein BDZ94DRAFT_970127 [Collybia nuda]
MLTMSHESFRLEAELPAELIQVIFRCLDSQSLLNLMTTNKRISGIACTILYQSIELDLDRARFASCMRALSDSEHSKLVNRLRVDFERRAPDGPNAIFFGDVEGAKLIHCLKHLPNLQHLTLNMSLFDATKPLNTAFPFKLVGFSTTLRCDIDLLAFVERQPTLQELRIDSSIEPPGLPLDNIRLPEVRVLRWGDEPGPNPAAFELLKRVSSIRDIHAIFSEPEMMESTMAALKYWQNPARAFFTILFDCHAIPLASSGIEGLSYLSFSESAVHPGCFNDVKELRLRNYPCLKALNFRWTEVTWRNFEAGAGLSEAIGLWFAECRFLENVTFDIIGAHGLRYRECRRRNIEIGS